MTLANPFRPEWRLDCTLDGPARSINATTGFVLVAEAICSALPLRVPAKAIAPGRFFDTFIDRRGSERSHLVIDILAPCGTPLVAVDDGVVVKLFLSKPGVHHRLPV